MVLVSDDGEKTVIKEMDGDSHVRIIQEEHDGEKVKVIKKKTDGDSWDISRDDDVFVEMEKI